MVISLVDMLPFLTVERVRETVIVRHHLVWRAGL